MKKVLIIGMTSNQGGIETFVLNIINQSLKSESPNTEFFILDTTRSEVAYADFFRRKNVSILKKVYPAGVLAVFKRRFLAKKFFMDYQFDVVHIQANSLNTVFWAQEAVKAGIPRVIFHSHNSALGHFNAVKKLVLTALIPLQRRGIHALGSSVIRLAASKEAGRWMFKDDSFEVIPNGIDLRRFSFDDKSRLSLRKTLNITDQNVISLVARFSDQKNHTRLIEIFEELLKISPDSKLLLVGAGENLESIKNMVSGEGVLNKNVILLGARSDIPEILSASDVVVMPSIYEGLPFSIVEAQASGLSCVVSSEAFGEESDITNAVKRVSLAKSNLEWARTILSLISTDRSAENYTELRKSRNVVVQHSNFSIENMTKLVLNAYW